MPIEEKEMASSKSSSFDTTAVRAPNTLPMTYTGEEEKKYTPDNYITPKEFYVLMNMEEYARMHPDKAFSYYRNHQCNGCFRLTIDMDSCTKDQSTGTHHGEIPVDYAEMDREIEEKVREWRRSRNTNRNVFEGPVHDEGGTIPTLNRVWRSLPCGHTEKARK